MPAALPIAQAHLDLVLLAVLTAVAVLLIIAYHSQVPYPILLVLGGAALGFIPGIPDVRLNPDVVLVIVLPPLLYAAAFFSSLRDVRDNLGSISLLAIGLVIERPKLAPHRDAIRTSLAGGLKLPFASVNVKATTGEGMGFVGRGEGVAALAVATLTRR